jgi:hypothetical protein
VLTQLTGPPEFEMAEEPSAPHGMPTAGRVSKPPGGVGDVVVVGVVERGTVVCGTVVVCAGVVVVAFGTGLVVVGDVVAGALTMGRGPTAGGGGGGGAGAMSAGDALVTGEMVAVGSAEVVSTPLGASVD